LDFSIGGDRKVGFDKEKAKSDINGEPGSGGKRKAKVVKAAE
jgi:hypothetical protein